MTSTRGRTSRSARKHEPALTERILVATEGAPSADAAIRMAATLAEGGRAQVTVLSVVTVAPLYTSGLGEPTYMQPMLPDERTLRGLRATAVAEQLRRLGAGDWPVRVVVGSVADEVARLARREHATLIITGIGRHKPIDRLLASETALKIVRVAPAPVLAVAPDAHGRPHTAVAAMDFGPASVQAARLGRALLAPDGDLVLAHVRPGVDVLGAWGEGWESLYETGAERRFAEIRQEIGAPDGVRVESMLLRGDTSAELLATAEARNAEVIVVAAQPHSRLERFLLGSTTAKLLRGAHCSVLVLPPAVSKTITTAPPVRRRREAAAPRRARMRPATRKRTPRSRAGAR